MRPVPAAPGNSPDGEGISPVSASVPLVDPLGLQELEEDLADRAVVRTFVRKFVDLSGSRYRRLRDALVLRDEEAAMETVLSLKTSATMVGAARLTQLALRQEKYIRGGRMDAAGKLLPEVETCVRQTCAELVDSYLA